jgi:hypothetical protein
MSIASRTAGWAAPADGLASASGAASAAPAAMAPQRVLTVPPSGVLHGCQGGGAAAPGTDCYCHIVERSNVPHSGNSPAFAQ